MTESHGTAGPDGAPVTPATPTASLPGNADTGGGPDQPHADAEATGPPAPGATAGTGLQPTSRDRRARRTWRRDWQITVVIAALIAGVVGALVYLSHYHRRNISLPSTLLGLHQVTSPQERRWAHNAVQRETSQGSLGALVAALYGGSAGAAFAVVAGTPCPNGGCFELTTRQLVQFARAGHPDATGFPPGPHGGSLICYSGASKTVGCVWIDQDTAAQVSFNRGCATTLADAAAKTRQLRDAIER